MSLEYAGGVILDAIRRKKAFVAFPRRMVWRVQMLRYLPRSWSDWLIRRDLMRARHILQDR